MSGEVRLVARARRDLLGEGPFWSAKDDAVYWVDILGQRVNRLRLGDGRVDEWSMPEMVGWVIERNGGGFAAGFAGGVKALTLDPVAIDALVDLPGEPAGNRMNDAVADHEGRLWAGTMPLTGDRPAGSLYRIDPDLAATRVDAGYNVANGPAISPDGYWLFHTDSHLGNVYRFPLHDDGSLGARETFIAFEPGWGSPDGMTFDAQGGLWIAHWGGGRVTRFDPQGRPERAIALPASQITSCCFAGAALDRMFVTSAADGVNEPEAGGLFEVDPGCHGLPPHRFGG